jgi:capsule polysaccharide export protein KpsE/RkpR
MATVENPRELEQSAEYGQIPGVTSSEPRHIVWLRLLWQQRLFLRRVTAWGFVLAILIALVLPPRYQSSIKIMPPDDQSTGMAMLAAFAGKGSSSALGGLGGSLGGLAGDLLGMKSSGALFIEMLQSRTVKDGLIQKFDLRKVYGTRYWESARKDLAQHTEIAEDKKSGVMSIAVTDRNRERAQQIAQAYVDGLDRLVVQVSTSAARRQRIFIEQRLVVVKQNLDKAAQEFSEYASKNGTLDVPSQAKAMVESEAQVEGELIAAQSELQGLDQLYTDSNIRVRTLRARIAELKHQVENMSGNKADLTSNSSDIAGDFPSIRKLPLLGVRWATLYRETKIQETVYELLTQQYELAKIQEAKEIPSVKVLDPADVPERKSFPPRSLIVILGTLMAFILGSMLVIGSAVWEDNKSAEKRFATEIWTELRDKNPKSPNAAGGIWSRVHRYRRSRRGTQ